MARDGDASLLERLQQERWPGSGEPPERDLDFVEVFAGDAAVSRGLKLLGFVGWSLDMRYSGAHDLLTAAGFRLLMEGIMRLRPGGLLWAAPPCSSWVWVSSHSTGRARSPTGNRNSAYVQSQNALVCRLLMLSILARARGCIFIWEQPSSSMMWRFAPMAAFVAEAKDLLECRMEMGAFGLKSSKLTRLWGNAPYLPELGQRLAPADRLGLRLRPDRMHTTKRWRDADGRARCQGGRDLKETQAYPIGFGAFHACQFENWRRGGVPAPQVPSPVLNIRAAWFLQDLLDPSFSWSSNLSGELKKRPRE